MHFTPQLQKHVHCSTLEVPGETLREALDSVFRDHPRLRGYLLDDQARLRQHIAIFVDGAQVEDRKQLSETLGETSEIYVMQALSGG